LHRIIHDNCMLKGIDQKKANLISSFLLIFIVFLGVWNVVYIGRKVDRNERQELLLRAQNISILLNQDDLKKLTGTVDDLGNPAYDRVKETLVDTRAINTDTRFIYIMGLTNQNTQFFYVDSEDPSSVDYSPPGQLYVEATETDIYNHINGIAYTSGPYSDEWGTWISAYAPVVDGETGAIIALVGMDVDADNFLSQISTAQFIVCIISLAIFLIILFLERLIKKSTAYETELEKINRDLSLSKEHLIEVEHQAGIGEISWSASTHYITLDIIVMNILGISNPKITFEEFTGYINPDDLKRITQEVELKKDTAGPVTLRYHLKDIHHKEHAITSICSIKRDAKGEILSMRCTAQDMTHIRN
jgi:hypothetical protein